MAQSDCDGSCGPSGQGVGSEKEPEEDLEGHSEIRVYLAISSSRLNLTTTSNLKGSPMINRLDTDYSVGTLFAWYTLKLLQDWTGCNLDPIAACAAEESGCPNLVERAREAWPARGRVEVGEAIESSSLPYRGV